VISTGRQPFDLRILGTESDGLPVIEHGLEDGGETCTAKRGFE
jgi:hypothetical protein